MLQNAYAFSGFSVSDLDEAYRFYKNTLGLDVDKDGMGLHIHLKNGGEVFAYEKDGHTPATFTILNFAVEDIDQAVDGLVAKGVTFERYTDMPTAPDKKGILRGKASGYGPDIAWFKDPSDNILAVLNN